MRHDDGKRVRELTIKICLDSAELQRRGELARVRRDAGYTAAIAARLLGIPPEELAAYERGIVALPPAIRMRMNQIYSVIQEAT